MMDIITRVSGVKGSIASLAVIALLSVACGGGTATPSPTPTAPAATSAAAASSSAKPTSTAVVLPKPEKTSIKLGHSALSGVGSATAILARQLNLYQKYGLTVETFQFNGPAQAIQALLAGQIDISDNSAAPVLPTVGSANPLQIVFVPRANDTDNLYSQKDIKTAADLKGKTIAISSFGSNSYAGALYALKALNLTDKDVTITAVGNDTQRLAALKSGAVAASIQDNTLEADLTAQGFNVLVKLATVQPPIGQPNTAITVPVDFQKKYPNTVLAVVAAQLEAMNYSRTKTADEIVPLLAKELTGTSVDDLKAQWAVYAKEPWTPKDGMCRPEDIQFAKQVAVAANPNLASIDALQACNNEFLLKLKDLGFQHQLGIPGY